MTSKKNPPKIFSAKYDDKITLDDIANAAGFSKFYFSKLFKEHTKITVFDYLRNVRCEEARRLIETTKLSITEISEKCGFEDIAYFTKVFKKETGILPSQVRNDL